MWAISCGSSTIAFGVLYKYRTPGSGPLKGGLSKGNVVEVELQNNSQKFTTNSNLAGRNWRDLYVCK